MRIVRIYTGNDDESHFEELDIPLRETRYGSFSEVVAAKGVQFRETQPAQTIDFHTAPRRQFVLVLAGRVEIETGDGSKCQFGPGDILLADDTTGHGHISREIEGPRRSIFIPVTEDLDAAQWR